MCDYAWRGDFASQELDELHSVAFATKRTQIDWQQQVKAHSLGWVTARQLGKLVGFVNVAWDGGTHAFILDTMVDPSVRRQNIGTKLIACAVDGARAADCEWLHVDFEAKYETFYIDACGFKSTRAGVLSL